MNKELNHVDPAKRTHAYEMGTDTGKVTAYTNTRASARKLAEAAGYAVRDVNMIG